MGIELIVAAEAWVAASAYCCRSALRAVISQRPRLDCPHRGGGLYCDAVGVRLLLWLVVLGPLVARVGFAQNSGTKFGRSANVLASNVLGAVAVMSVFCVSR